MSLWFARAVALSTLGGVVNSTHSASHLVESVAAASASVATFTSPEEKQAVAGALRAAANGYAEKKLEKDEEQRKLTLDAKANATEAQIAAGEQISKEVQVEQLNASMTALGALRSAEAHSGVGTLLGDKARELETKLLNTQADAQHSLDALNEVRDLALKKQADVSTAERSLNEVRRKKAQTEKEAEMAEQIAREKRQDVDAIEQNEAAAEKKLDDARNEAEAVGDMVDRKQKLSDSAAQELDAEATTIKQMNMAPPTKPVVHLAGSPAPSSPGDYSTMKAENDALKKEKDELKRQLAQLDGDKQLEAENAKLEQEKEALQQELAAKLAAKAASSASSHVEPVEPIAKLRKKLRAGA